MNKTQESNSFFVCVECGEKAENVYRTYENGITKLSICGSCQCIVDEYTEFDGVLTFLNLLLHKIQAFRHIIYNRNIASHKKLLVLYLLADTYCKWSYFKCSVDEKVEMFEWQALLEKQFFLFFLVTISEYISYSIVAIFLIYSAFKSSAKINLSWKSILKVLIVSHYGRLFNMAAAIWGSNDKILSVLLIKMLVFTTTVQTFKALLSRASIKIPFIIASVSMVTSSTISWLMQDVLIYQ